MDARDVPDHAAHDEKLDGPHGDRIIADRPVRPGETDPPAASASLDQTATKKKFRDWNHSKEGTIILGDVNEDGTIPPIDADSTELTAYAAHRLEIHRIIIPSANLAGTTIHRRRGHRPGPHRRAAEPGTADAENAVAGAPLYRR